MYGQGPFECQVENLPAGGKAPRWILIAMFVPFVLFLATAIATILAEDVPAFRPAVGPLWAVMAIAFVFGFGSVFASCIYRLARAVIAARSTRA